MFRIILLVLACSVCRLRPPIRSSFPAATDPDRRGRTLYLRGLQQLSAGRPLAVAPNRNCPATISTCWRSRFTSTTGITSAGRTAFASADYTARQRQLGANNQQRTIYTPEFFVNGMEARGARTILDKIHAGQSREAPLASN